MSEELKEVLVEETVDSVMETVIHDENEPVVSTKRLLEAGCHFGHQTRRWNPRMAQYIYGSRNGIYILDLVKTAQKLQEAYQDKITQLIDILTTNDDVTIEAILEELSDARYDALFDFIRHNLDSNLSSTIDDVYKRAEYWYKKETSETEKSEENK